MSVLSTYDLGLSYQHKPIFQQMNLKVQSGEFVALVGPSGAGKSSLLRCLSGLQKPSQGQIYFEDELLSQPHPHIALGFQDATLLPWLNVAQNVGFGLDFKNQTRLSAAQQAERVQTALQQVGLWAVKDYFPDELSGGMAQRVALARSVARQPRVLLLDEPFSALDEATRAEMQDLLLQLHDQLRCTVVLVTHDLGEAIRLAQRIVMVPAHGTSQQAQTWAVPPATKQSRQLALQLHEQIHQSLRFTPLELSA